MALTFRAGCSDYFKEGVVEKYTNQVKNRVKRMEGQLRGILKMVEEEKSCKTVITQLSAISSVVDRTVGVIVSTNLLECVRNAEGDDENEVIQEAVNLVV